MTNTTTLNSQNLIADSKAVLSIISATAGMLYGATKMSVHGAAEVARDQLGPTVDAGLIGGFTGGDKYAQAKLLELKDSLLSANPTPAPEE